MTWGKNIEIGHFVGDEGCIQWNPARFPSRWLRLSPARRPVFGVAAVAGPISCWIFQVLVPLRVLVSWYLAWFSSSGT